MGQSTLNILPVLPSHFFQFIKLITSNDIWTFLELSVIQIEVIIILLSSIRFNTCQLEEDAFIGVFSKYFINSFLCIYNAFLFFFFLLLFSQIWKTNFLNLV